ncbi:MAG: excinuclease ABC subunit UvrC [Candidatus Marinimicrobia bacterium]|nr:excinuclease ABC subunit UvrC [Candidatus Neomarinimicrobiota bacterium]
MPAVADEKLKKKIDDAPVNPGCYIFRDKNDEILYIGKARHLKNRIKSYFVKGNKRRPKTRMMLKKVNNLEFIVTNSEVEALILENSLIKEHQPKYNILLRDDKTFPYVKLTNEPFPRVISTRRIKNDNAKYYGPYTDAGNLRKTIRIIHEIFPLRQCKKNLSQENIENNKYERPCLNYNIEKCLAPCQGWISEEAYQKMIGKVEDFLNGKTDQVIEFFKEKMDKAAENLKYEEAAKYRDKIDTIRKYATKQSAELTDFSDKDAISIKKEAEHGCAVVFRIRQGKIINRDKFFLENIIHESLDVIMQNFLQRFYNNTEFIPDEVLINHYPERRELLSEWLSGLKDKKVNIVKPAKLNRKRIIRMAGKNAQYQLKKYILKKSKRKDYIPKTLKQLQEDLNLNNLPRRIEAFDISHIKGEYTVASMVYFENAAPKKSEYRRFRIKSVQGVDDYASMQEVIHRRYTRRLEEEKPLPDLILIDGGKGQLSAAKKVLDELDLSDIPIIGLAKRLEEIFMPEVKNSLILPKDSIALTLLKRIRDESHRFAIQYHRKIRSSGSIKSQLDDIPGLGKKKKQALIKHYKSISKLKSLSEEELTAVKGIGHKLAHTIWMHLHERS